MSRRARWAVPGAALAVTGGVLAGSLMSVAQAAPALPARTPAQLLAQEAQAARGNAPALTGTVVETVSLGLPSLPHTGNPTSIASLLTGSHTIKVWYAGPQHYRLAVPESLSETDVVRDGGTAWLWQSTKNAVTEFTLPARSAPQAPATVPSVTGPLTPQQAAQQALAKVGPTTAVSVASNVIVAGRPAYELVLAPKDARSLVGQIRIALDASNGVPLRVQVFARGSASPAISVGYTAVSFGAPPAAQTSFTPPPGATVSRVDLTGREPAGHDAGPGVTTIGSGWLTVAETASAGLTAPGGPGENADVLRALLASATPVSGAWGSGRLLHTSLVTVLLTDSGHAFVGAVQPSVLYAAAARP